MNNSVQIAAAFGMTRLVWLVAARCLGLAAQRAHLRALPAQAVTARAVVPS